MLESKANWVFNEQEKIPLEEISDSLDLSPIIKGLLAERNLVKAEKIKQFLSPDLAHLHKPKKLAMIDQATQRIRTAISNDEKILIYGDYDADGVSSTVLLLKAIKEMGGTCGFYIPNRFTEGYGPNEHAFKQAHDDGFSVIITVDTGISSIHEAQVAKELGIDLIITDHHETKEQLPDAFAIIHPLHSPEYLFKELAGVGVAFKLAEHLLGYFPEHLLDFVAIGTIADLVPLVEENRIFAYFGLRELTATKNIGLQALKRVCQIDGAVTEEDVGFLLGPRINAAGRIQDADLAVELFMAEDTKKATNLAHMLNDLNVERQQMVRKMTKEAETLVEQQETQGITIVAKEGWNEGVLGIVASQLVRKYDRPAIVLTIKPETNEMKGSARSIPKFNLFENLNKIKDLFTTFGGHSQAAGMTFDIANETKIKTQLNELIYAELSEEDFKQDIQISKSLKISTINQALIEEINQLAPFGMANPKPMFHIKDMPTDMSQIGSMKNHLKLQFKEETAMLEGIGFGLGDLFNHLTPHTDVSIVGELGINEWNGNKKAQIIIRDMSINETQLFDFRGRKNIDITPHILQNKTNVIIGEETINNYDHLYEETDYITYDTHVDDIEQADALYIFDLPNNLLHLQKIINAVQPVNIYACYVITNSKYLTSLPSRDAFKWFYALIRNRKQLHLKTDMAQIKHVKQWTKDRVMFIVSVFEELEFIRNSNGILKLNPSPVKRELSESPIYQDHLIQAEIEKELYYSNYLELRHWLISCKNNENSFREEIVHGL